jgi:hypothetical protein
VSLVQVAGIESRIGVSTLLGPLIGAECSGDLAAALEHDAEVDRCLCAPESIGLPVGCLSALEVASILEDVV